MRINGSVIGSVVTSSASSAIGIWSVRNNELSNRIGIWPVTYSTSGSVLYLDAGEPVSYPGSGTSWYDLSGNGNTGILTNGPTFSSANGGSIVFDGSNDYVIDSSTVNMPTGSASRTIQIWVYPKTDTCPLVQLGTGGGGNQGYYLLFYNIGGTIYLFSDGINAGNNITFSGTNLPTLNAWNHITFGNSGSSWFYYLNGVSKLSGSLGVTLNTIGQKYIVGTRDDTAATPTNGNIASVLIFNRALTETEILQNFNATRARFGI